MGKRIAVLAVLLAVVAAVVGAAWVSGHRALGTVTAYDKVSHLVAFEMKDTSGPRGLASLLFPRLFTSGDLAVSPHVHDDNCGHEEGAEGEDEGYLATYDPADLPTLSEGDAIQVELDAEEGNRVSRILEEAPED